MLNGISPLISPELLKVLCEMGHGDEIVLADANVPAEAIARDTAYGKAIRLDGTGMVPLLEGILPLFPLDSYDENNFRLM
ncbi:MAG: RbsD/FucU domain-containing protein, partial [Candidatus Faecousia sp.]|nr:RbsD/FucU domain-containing protein [Candidatus Faecousia sp.]